MVRACSLRDVRVALRGISRDCRSGASCPEAGRAGRWRDDDVVEGVLPYAEVAGALVKVQESDAWSATSLAFEFLTLTGMRSGEVRGARWSEVDLAAQAWVVPADRMKSGREHRVPLSGRPMAILGAAKALPDCDPESLVFPSMTGRMLSDSTLSKLVRELGIGRVPHGMRSRFREWAAERTDIPREVAEEALAHVNPNKVERCTPAVGPFRSAPRTNEVLGGLLGRRKRGGARVGDGRRRLRRWLVCGNPRSDRRRSRARHAPGRGPPLPGTRM